MNGDDDGPTPLSFVATVLIALATLLVMFQIDIPWAKIGEALAGM